MNLVTCCTQKQEARKPISHKTGEFMKQSIDRNKKLNKNEEEIIINIKKKTLPINIQVLQKDIGIFIILKIQPNNLNLLKEILFFLIMKLKI